MTDRSDFEIYFFAGEKPLHLLAHENAKKAPPFKNIFSSPPFSVGFVSSTARIFPFSQQKGCAGNVFTGSFPGPLSGRYPGSCEHPPPYASGLGYLVFHEVLRLTPRMIAQRGSFDHAIKWRVLAAFCRIFEVKMPKKSDI